MATVQLATGQIVECVKLTDVSMPGSEGDRSATAHIDGQTYEVYCNPVDGDNTWYEQVDIEMWRSLYGSKGIVEGSVVNPDE